MGEGEGPGDEGSSVGITIHGIVNRARGRHAQGAAGNEMRQISRAARGWQMHVGIGVVRADKAEAGARYGCEDAEFACAGEEEERKKSGRLRAREMEDKGSAGSREEREGGAMVLWRDALWGRRIALRGSMRHHRRRGRPGLGMRAFSGQRRAGAAVQGWPACNGRLQGSPQRAQPALQWAWRLARASPASGCAPGSPPKSPLSLFLLSAPTSFEIATSFAGNRR